MLARLEASGWKQWAGWRTWRRLALWWAGMQGLSSQTADGAHSWQPGQTPVLSACRPLDRGGGMAHGKSHPSWGGWLLCSGMAWAGRQNKRRGRLRARAHEKARQPRHHSGQAGRGCSMISPFYSPPVSLSNPGTWACAGFEACM